MQLTLFYDSYCPLCVAEMERLKALDTENRLRIESIHAPDFSERYPHVDPVAADRYLHAQYSDGSMIYGLDVTHQAWRLVGKHRWLAILRWPMLRCVADIVYRVFARNRYRLSYLLTGKSRCDSCALTKESNSNAS